MSWRLRPGGKASCSFIVCVGFGKSVSGPLLEYVSIRAALGCQLLQLKSDGLDVLGDLDGLSHQCRHVSLHGMKLEVCRLGQVAALVAHASKHRPSQVGVCDPALAAMVAKLQVLPSSVGRCIVKHEVEQTLREIDLLLNQGQLLPLGFLQGLIHLLQGLSGWPARPVQGVEQLGPDESQARCLRVILDEVCKINEGFQPLSLGQFLLFKHSSQVFELVSLLTCALRLMLHPPEDIKCSTV